MNRLKRDILLAVYGGVFYRNCIRTRLCTYAVTIGPNVMASDFDTYSIAQFQSLVLNIIFWFLRVTGVVVLMWGIYGMVTAKKDGDADSINQAMMKCVFGAVFLCMPGILKALKIIV